MIPFADPLALTRALVRVDSRNPSLVPGAPGEGECARLLAGVLAGWGFAVEVQEAAPGRPNVLARLGRAEAGAGTLMLNGHLDVVGTEGMVHAPFDAEERGGRMYGRGATDMKGGVAAMCAAAARAHAAGALRGEVLVAAVADEEYESVGTRALLDGLRARGATCGGALVTEPTRLAIMPAHRGFAWYTVTLHGRAAHGSRYDIGVDAIRHAGLLLAELDALDADELPRRAPHGLLGRGSLHASLIEGGIGLTTYPDRCVLRLERRTIPGESAAGAQREIEAACDRVRARRPEFRADVALDFAQPPSDVPADAPLVRALDAALRAAGESAPVAGMSAWTDAALLNEAGIPAICFGPGDIALAHAAEEYVETAEIARATDVMQGLVSAWCA
ncbi:ArgE/DapE family deacylase [Roseisolibacter sp. H3M3-2]|uniref:ArgE/DapE family deacylase n=1 Tax=Roseisolibacter sp. H3M3-2 TaxID=3031323 RepID=UPI0023DA900B|nr:ArgE/DapE family deacylase [Roseisolibacter sp. H3M3-2]MDF1501662.1 ArgE/DapE family deacylase [Roseisolibacter sp. H3M3-2]